MPTRAINWAALRHNCPPDRSRRITSKTSSCSPTRRASNVRRPPTSQGIAIMSSQAPGALRRFWNTLRRPSAKYSILALLLVGFIAGIIFWGGFNTGLEATNTKAFCIGCHVMHDNVYQEYVGTVHDTNRTGVRAICSDCHVPKDWTHKMARKIVASNEVWQTLMGTIDTRAKFEAH